jgi:hypothetical protein
MTVVAVAATSAKPNATRIMIFRIMIFFVRFPV